MDEKDRATPKELRQWADLIDYEEGATVRLQVTLSGDPYKMRKLPFPTRAALADALRTAADAREERR